MVPSPLTSITPALSKLESEFPGTGPQPVELSKRQGNLESQTSAFTPHNNSNAPIYMPLSAWEGEPANLRRGYYLWDSCLFLSVFVRKYFIFLNKIFLLMSETILLLFFLSPKEFLTANVTNQRNNVKWWCNLSYLSWRTVSEIIRFHNVKNCTETWHDVKLTYGIFVSGCGEQ